MTAPWKRTDEEDFQLLAEIEAFSEELRRLLGNSTSSFTDDRRSISALPPKTLLEESLYWVKRFLVETAAQEPMTPRDVGGPAYALWLFSSYMAYSQGLTVLDADFDALVEFFFWWYPRHSQTVNEPLTERLLDSLRDFFIFLADEGALPGHQFMQDFLPLREKALRLLRLYGLLDSESPFFEEQFNALFGLDASGLPR